MLAAVSGLAYLLATLLKMEQSLGYFLPLPIVIAGMRSGPGAAWNTMLSTACLLLGGWREGLGRVWGWVGGTGMHVSG
jgi:hypothetical protein